MLVPLVRIGNSKGVRLPKAVIEQAGLTEEIDLEVKDGKVILSSTKQSRTGWEAAAEACHRVGNDRLIVWNATSIFDFEGTW